MSTQFVLYLASLASIVTGSVMMYMFLTCLFEGRPGAGLLWAGLVGATFVGAMVVAEWLLF